MTIQFDKRLKRLETSDIANKKPNFRHVPQNELQKWREILTVATDTGDWSGYLEDLAVDAPSVYAAFKKAGY
jgi:hypothetical protein